MRAWATIILMATTAATGGCDDSGGFSEGEGFTSPVASVLARRVLDLRLDAAHPAQRFAVPVAVEPDWSSTILSATILSANTQAVGSLDPIDFAVDDINGWFGIGTGQPLQIITFNGDTNVLSVGTFAPPLELRIELTLKGAGDDDFDGEIDTDVAAIGVVTPLTTTTR